MQLHHAGSLRVHALCVRHIAMEKTIATSIILLAASVIANANYATTHGLNRLNYHSHSSSVLKDVVRVAR